MGSNPNESKVNANMSIGKVHNDTSMNTSQRNEDDDTEPEPTRYQAIGLSAVKKDAENLRNGQDSRNEAVNEAKTESDSLLIGLRKTTNETLPNEQTLMQTVTIDPSS